MDDELTGGPRAAEPPRPEHLLMQLTQLLRAGNRELRRLNAELEELQASVRSAPR